MLKTIDCSSSVFLRLNFWYFKKVNCFMITVAFGIFVFESIGGPTTCCWLSGLSANTKTFSMLFVTFLVCFF